jgi:predicted transcriptional regulator
VDSPRAAQDVAGAEPLEQRPDEMHSNARMQVSMRTTIELSDRTYTRLRSSAAERGMRGFSSIVEEALEHFFEGGGENDLDAALAEAEGAWSASDVSEWERAREEAWASWQAGPYSTPTS